MRTPSKEAPSQPAPRTTDLRDLRRIPGVGASVAQDLVDMGIGRVTDLQGRDPEQLYEEFCTLRGMHIDRCMLYVFRCAVYFASEPNPDPERLKWWNWKDSRPERQKRRDSPSKRK